MTLKWCGRDVVRGRGRRTQFRCREVEQRNGSETERVKEGVANQLITKDFMYLIVWRGIGVSEIKSKQNFTDVSLKSSGRTI